VCMERSAELPARCVVCNEAASSRISRKLYWSPGWWRAFGGVAPFALLAAGFYAGQSWLVGYFWPLVVILIIVNFFMRQSLKLALGVCGRHRKQRRVVIGSSLVAMAIMLLGLLNITAFSWATWALGGGAVLMAILALAQSYIGVQAVSLKSLDARHAWLARTGKPFREALPELPGA